MGQEKALLISETKKTFSKAGFDTSICDLRCCFDIIARGKTITFLIIAAPNIDSVSNDYIKSLKCLCYYFKAHPIVIGSRTKSMDMLKGVVYTREDVPAISLETLEDMILEDSPPLVYTDRGGIYVRIEGDILKKFRENIGLSLGEFAKEIGVSRSTLYDYEHSKRGVDITTAMKIEEMIKLPLIKPIDVINRLIEKSSTTNEIPKSPLEKNVFKIFDDIGFKVHPTNRTPFNAVVEEDNEKTDMIMLTGVSNLNPKNIKKRIMVVHDVSKVLETDAFFVINSSKSLKSIEGVPIVLMDEIQKINDCDTILEVLKQRKKECEYK